MLQRNYIGDNDSGTRTTSRTRVSIEFSKYYYHTSLVLVLGVLG